MLRQAVRELDLDLSRSFLVGDKLSDLGAGHSAGCRRDPRADRLRRGLRRRRARALRPSARPRRGRPRGGGRLVPGGFVEAGTEHVTVQTFTDLYTYRFVLTNLVSKNLKVMYG